MPVRWIGFTHISRIDAEPLTLFPIRVCAGALGQGLPVRDLLVSPCHALFLDNALVQAGALVNGTTVVRETGMAGIFSYWHVELDRHALLLAEGVPAESFLPDVEHIEFANWCERVTPQFLVELPFPRAKSARQLSAATRQRLVEAEKQLAKERLWAA